MRVAVLGGAGYIGSHTVKSLLDRGYDVTVIDNLRTGYVEAIDKRAEFEKGDIRDTSFLKEALAKKKIDAVMHFAACSLVGESVKAPLKYYNNNVGGAIVLLEVMAEKGIDKIVFSSTAATYGEPQEIPICEDDRTEPENPYGETKLAMEKMFLWTSKAHNIRYVSLRYFNAAGADLSGELGEAHDPETHLIPIILQTAAGKREAVSVFGDDYNTKDGTCVRDYIHVTDLADAHILALEYLIRGGKSDIFNLGNGKGFTVREVIESARRVTGEEIPEKIAPRRQGDPAWLIASNDKVRDVLGWNPVYTDIDEIVSSAWKWYKTHPEGYKR